jgi:Apoptosis-antagonizing transcription factor, C-terminal
VCVFFFRIAEAVISTYPSSFLILNVVDSTVLGVQVDRKASKGRKIRYTKHPKLENFMFPLPAPLSAGTRSDASAMSTSLGSVGSGSGSLGAQEGFDSTRFFQSLFQ